MSSLNPNEVYEELVSVRLVGMMLTVIVRQDLRKNVLRYETQTVGTGRLILYSFKFIDKLVVVVENTKMRVEEVY